VPRSPLARRLVVVAALLAAVGFLALGARYQDDTTAAVALTGERTLIDPAGAAPPADANPVRAFFPSSGQGSTCTEPVGVELVPGFAASLTINGVDIDPARMNDPAGAAGSINRFTYGPEEGCPHGELLRPRSNVVEACVWRLGDSPASCRTFRFEFDAL
jgi:hypothetical protein